MNKLNRRTFNNVLIFTILCFILLFNLPNLIKNHLKSDKESQIHSQVIPLLPSPFYPSGFYFPKLTLQNEKNEWQSNMALVIPAQELVQRWLSLSGTLVDNTLVEKITPILNEPQNLRIEYNQGKEFYMVTYYETSNFWLMRNWQGQWLAVSVDLNYLMPLN